jgi:hypothetical protein
MPSHRHHHHHLDQSIMSAQGEGEPRDYQIDNFINDWSLWGQDSFMGQNVDDYINLLNFPYRE